MQQRNNYTDIEDFLNDTSFQLWVLSRIDQQAWEEWTLEDHQRAKLVEDARMWLLAMKVSQDQLSPKDLDFALQATWSKIDYKIASEKWNPKTVVKRIQYSWFKGVAAVFFFGLFFGLAYTHYYRSTSATVNYETLIDENPGNLVEQTNNSNKTQTITLSDGSAVLLQPKSKLSYPKIFTGNDRKVYLSGEGFFEISKNPKKPFYVYANEIVTKVVGTSFRIKAYANDPNIEVLVRTGIVKVRSNQLIPNIKDQEIALLPNQALRFTRENLNFDKITDITQDQILSRMGSTNIEHLSFEFTDIPVEQIFKTLEQAYLIDIDFPKNKLKECHLTTSLNDQPLSEKLNIICKSIGNDSSYIMNGNQIIILSNGCN